jgi:hypothetical protein
MTLINIVITIEESQIIANALIKEPYYMVNELLIKLRKQADQQAELTRKMATDQDRARVAQNYQPIGEGQEQM